jgi:peptide-methionine (S)-S-oxide reductase
MLFGSRKSSMIAPEQALPGRLERPFSISNRHAVLDASIEGPFSDDVETAYFGLGCFWGAEQLFWSIPGVISTAVGYQGGFTPNPTYEEVCSGKTGHTEAVQVVYNPAQV